MRDRIVKRLKRITHRDVENVTLEELVRVYRRARLVTVARVVTTVCWAIMAVLLVLVYLVMNLIVDVLYAVLDPRIRYE